MYGTHSFGPGRISIARPVKLKRDVGVLEYWSASIADLGMRNADF